MAENHEEAQIPDSGESSTSPLHGVTKEDVRQYFSEVTCNLRVLGSQLGLKPYELDDLRLREQSDPRQILVDECFNKDKITSWQELVNVLEKPALNQGAIADQIRGKFLRQSSLESTTSSRTSSLQSPLSPMETNSGQITLPDAVNFIMKLSIQELPTLGNNLGLDEARVKEIVSPYYDSEQHQRLMELWFRKESNPTWEKLLESMASLSSYRRESSTSTASVQTNPYSPTESMMIISNETEIKSRFSYLLNSIQYSLEANHVGGEEIRQFLVLMFGRAGDCIPKTDKISETFESVTVNYLWSYDNHDVLEAMVSRHLPDHVSLISEYQSHLSGPPPAERPLDNYTTEHYQKLTVRLDIDYKMSLLSMTYVRDLWRSFVNQFNIPSLTAVIDRISEGSLEIVWLVLPHVGDLIREAASQSELFFREHDIVFVAINDHILYDARQMKGKTDQQIAEEKKQATVPSADSAVHAPKSISTSRSIAMGNQRSGFSIDESVVFGSGSYGTVYRARRDADRFPCVAKVLHLGLADPSNKERTETTVQRIRDECSFLESLKHTNLVRYLGVARDCNLRAPVLLMEQLPDAESSTKMLECFGENPLPYFTELNICSDIASALEYLHSIVRNLSSNNVFVIAKMRAKVADFGMCRLNDATNSTCSRPKTIGVYMPSEALEEDPIYTPKFDCFSQGVIIIQVCTRKQPDPGNIFETNTDSQALIPECERRNLKYKIEMSFYRLQRIA